MLVIHPKFEEEWKDSILDISNYEFVEYDESGFYRKGILWKMIQALVFICDTFLPRRFALTSYVRKFRIKEDYAKSFWEKVLQLYKKHDQVIIIKPTGLKKIYIPNDFDIEKQLNIFLWDSLARYPVDKQLLPYIKGTTSPYDARSKNIALFTFFATERKNISGDRPPKNSYFVGRFSLFRASKAIFYCLCQRSYDVKFFFGNSPINLKFGNLKFSKDRIDLDSSEFDAEFVLFDLNEDSPSFRLDSRYPRHVVVESGIIPQTLEFQFVHAFDCSAKTKPLKFVTAITFHRLLSD